MTEIFRRGLRRIERLLLWLISLRWETVGNEDIRRVVIFEMTRLGDVVASTSLLRPLQKAFPSAEIQWWVRQPLVGLFEGLKGVKVQGMPVLGFSFLRQAWSRRHQLREPGLMVISASPAVRHSLLCALSRPTRALGYVFPSLGDRGYLPQATPQEFSAECHRRGDSLDGREHMVTRALACLHLAGIAPLKSSPYLGGYRGRRKGVLLHPGANWSWRRWPLEHFVSLGLSLARGGHSVSWVFDKQAIQEGGWSQAHLEERCGNHIQIISRSSLADFVTLCGHSRLFIGNDSGPLHVAAAAGCPCLGLYGPNLPQRSGPWPLGNTGPHQVIEGDAPCRPCEQRVCHLPGAWCMSKITISRVLATARKMLK